MLKLNLKRKDIVLEVGSGDFPNIYSDVLVDKYPHTNRCRNFDLKTDGRPLIVAEGESLPFRDNAFDYCISSNAVTYSDRPEKFLGELMRVASRGLLIVPTELQERLYDTPYHRWFINYIDGKLIFRPKEINRSFGRFFHLLYKENRLFREFHDKNISLFYIVVDWKEKIPFEIQRNNLDSPINLSEEKEIFKHLSLKLRPPTFSRHIKSVLPNNLKYSLLKNFIKFSRWPRPKLDICKFIVCPVCRQALQKSNNNFNCFYCNLEFPIKENIPYLLVDAKGSI